MKNRNWRLFAAPILSAVLLITPVVDGNARTAYAEGSYSGAAAATDEVTFPDAYMEKAIRAELGKSSGPITKEDMLNLRQISRDNIDPAIIEGIRDLTGLEYATNLQTLNIWANGPRDTGIQDLSPLRNLTNLTYVVLMNNQIRDLSPFQNLVNITDLNLFGNQIQDITPLQNMTQIQDLNLNNNQIRDVSPLRNMHVANTALHLAVNDIEDLSPVLDLVEGQKWNGGTIDLAFNFIDESSLAVQNAIQTIRAHQVKLFMQPQNGRVSGTVRDASGHPVANAKVSAAGTSTRETYGQTLTLNITGKSYSDANGNFVITQSSSNGSIYPLHFVPEGTYTMTVEASGFTTSSKTLQVAGGKENPVNVSLTAAGSDGSVQTGTLPPSLSKYFANDVKGHWAEPVLTNALYADILAGYREPDGQVTLRPDQSITRAEFVTLLVRALQLQSSVAGKTFDDVPTDSWFSDYVRIASSLGVVQGINEREFAPNRPIQRDEIVTLLVRAFSASISFNGQKQFADVPVYWAAPYIQQAAAAGIVNGYPDGNFKPFASASRAESVQMLFNALKRETGHLPDDTALTETVLNNEKENLEASNNQDINRIYEINDRYGTSFYKAMYDWNTDLLKSALDKGYTQEVALKGNLSASVLAKFDRLAVVDLKDAVYEVTLRKGDQVIRQSTQDTSGTMLLKKMPDGTWKIYAAYMPNMVKS